MKGNIPVNWLGKLERKCSKIGFKGIRNLMSYIIAMNAVVFILYYVTGNATLLYKLMLIPELVLRGEVWRLVTFLAVPPATSPLWLILALYFYYLIGTNLEHEWGKFKFTFYYLTGAVFTIIGSFISGGISTASYLNLSLFLAFACIFPNFQVMLFFVLPVKMKYLAYLNAAFLLYSIIMGQFETKIAIIVSLMNFLLFFGKELYLSARLLVKSKKRHRIYSTEIAKAKSVHRCYVCGKTEYDDRYLEFRYCVKCDGDKEYCMEHLAKHEHILKSGDDN